MKSAQSACSVGDRVKELKESTAVGIRTDTTTDQETADVAEESTEKVSSDAQQPQDIHDAKSVDDSVGASSDGDESGQNAENVEPEKVKRRISWSWVFAFGVLPGLALLLATTAAALKWQDVTVGSSGTARIESLGAAKDSTVALLSYQPDTVEKDLGAARDRLTGTFKESYTRLTHDVVIPGAKQQHISAVATVPAAASVSATPNHAVALVFVDQTVVVGTDAPTETVSCVRVTMEKIGDRWLISEFDPV